MRKRSRRISRSLTPNVKVPRKSILKFGVRLNFGRCKPSKRRVLSCKPSWVRGTKNKSLRRDASARRAKAYFKGHEIFLIDIIEGRIDYEALRN